MSVELGSVWIDNDSDLLVIVKSLEAKFDGKVTVIFNYIVRTGDKSIESASELELFLNTKTKLVRHNDSDYEKGYEYGVQYMKMQYSNDKYLEVSDKLSLTEDEVDYSKALKRAHEDGFNKGKDFNKDDQNLNYRIGFNDGWHDCEASFELGNEFTDSIQEQAYDEGYDQAIDDLIEAGVIGEEEYLDEDFEDDYSEYEFGDVEDDDEDGEEEYCFSKELDRILNGTFVVETKSTRKNKEDLDEYNRGYEDGKSRGITLGYNKRDYEESRVGGIDGSERKHSHYFKDVRHLDYLDVYQVCKLFPVDDDSGAITHSIKKLLVAGGRGAGKDMIKDITEARDTLNRYLQIEGIEE